MPGAVPSSPTARRSGCPGSSSSSRYVTTTSAPSASARRASSLTMSSVASSAQCTSSITAIVGGRARNSSSSATNTACGFSPSRIEAGNAPSTAAAMSISGLSGRGVPRASHAPHSTRVRRASRRRRSRARGCSCRCPPPRDEHQPASTAGDGREALLQGVEELGALEQPEIGTGTFGDRTHGGIVRCSMSEIKQPSPAKRICGRSASSRSRAHRARRGAPLPGSAERVHQGVHARVDAGRVGIPEPDVQRHQCGVPEVEGRARLRAGLGAHASCWAR